MIAQCGKPVIKTLCVISICVMQFAISPFPVRSVSSAPVAIIPLQVDTAGDNPALSACSDLDPFDCSLRGAVNHANADTGNTYIINLPAGTYLLNYTSGAATEDGNASGDLDIIHPNLTLQGEMMSTTIINGNGTDRVIDQRGYEDNLTINDLTITNGQLENGEGDGAGIKVEVGNFLTLNHVTVSNNVTGSSEDGGGIFGLTSATLTINGSTISGNQAQDGGGIAASFCQLFIVNSTISDNHAGNTGGGIASVAGGTTINVDRSLIQTNTANKGGGIANTSGSSLIVTDSTIESNQAALNGGGLNLFGSTTLTNVTLHGNSADGPDFGNGGGGIYLIQTASLENVTLVSNTATMDGGGIYVFNGGVLSLDHVTLALNSSSRDGKALFVAITATVNTVSTIFSETGSYTACSIDAGANWNNSFYNLSNDSSCKLIAGFDIISTSPGFADYGDHGGSTFTMSLQPTSAAIDHGKPGDPADRLDQRGIPIMDGDGVGLTYSDIGAYEYIPPGVWLPLVIRPMTY